MESKRPPNPPDDDAAEPAMKKTRISVGDNATQVLDRRGDLILVAGEGDAAVRFRVCSRAMARSSPVWDVMLFGPFIEGKSQQATDEWSVALPEDDPEALFILLRGIHGDLVDIPKTLSLDQLFNLAVLCDKYNTTSTLRTFWDQWVNQADPGSLELKTFTSQLWIAHSLGYYHYFAATLVVLLSHLRQKEHDTLVLRGAVGDEILDDDHHYLAAAGLPKESLVRGLHALFIEAAQGPRNAMKTLTSSTNASNRCCRATDASAEWRKLCDRALLGGLHFALRFSKLSVRVLDNKDEGWPATRHESLTDFIKLLNELRTSTVADSGIVIMVGANIVMRNGDTSHVSCAPWDWIAQEDVLVHFLSSVMEVVGLDEGRFTRQQRQSGVAIPSRWNDDEVPMPKLFANLMRSFGRHGSQGPKKDSESAMKLMSG